MDTIEVSGPCSIDFSTLQTTGALPKIFLQKIGFPSLFVDYLPDFFSTAIRFFPVFLSHSAKDKEFARKLYDDLIKRGILVWFDEINLKPGDDAYESISRGISHFDKMILVCSQKSLEESWWVDREIDRALSKERKLTKKKGERVDIIIPIKIDDFLDEWEGAKKDDILRYIAADFRNWRDEIKYNSALEELIRALHVDKSDQKPPSYL